MSPAPTNIICRVRKVVALRWSSASMHAHSLFLIYFSSFVFHHTRDLSSVSFLSLSPISPSPLPSMQAAGPDA